MFETIQKIIAEQLSIDEESIRMSSSLKDDLGADSLDLFELVMAVEEQFETEIDTEELEKINTVEDMIQYLKSKGIED